jgi:ABC-2 type transport system permease protein
MLSYLWLEAKRQWRNREVLIFRLGLPTAVYFIQSVALGDGGGSSSEKEGGGGHMVAIAALAAVISGLAAGPSLGEERANGWLRQLRVTPLRPATAVAAKVAVAMSFVLPSMSLVAVVAVLAGDVSLGWGQAIEVILLMWVATIPLTAVGTLIGLTFAGEAAQAATTLAFIVLWLAGGIFRAPSELSEPLATLAQALPSYGVAKVGWSAAGDDSLPSSVVGMMGAWTAGAGALAAVAWRRVVTR